MHDQLVLSSWIDWHQGELASIINNLVSTGLVFTCIRSALLICWGSASCKNNLGMCIRSLSLSLRELGVQ